MYTIPEIPSICDKIMFENYYIIKASPDDRLFRSVIYNHQDKMVCFSPPKSTAAVSFTYPLSTCRIEEFVEGTMINLFYDNQWIVSTKSNVGANCTFYSNITFKTLFDVAFSECGLSENMLTKTHTYSFVLQHPLNKIVIDFPSPTLVLIAVYKIDGNQVTEVVDPLQTKLRGPIQYSFNETELDSFLKLAPYTIKGIVLHCQGYRTKFYTPSYDYVKNLRGNYPTLTHQAIVLHKNNTVNQFLTFFPEYTTSINKYCQDINNFTNHLYSCYIECFIHKKKVHKDFSKAVKYHMYKLHEDYLHTRKSIHKKLVIQYVNSLSPPELVASISYFTEDLIASNISMQPLAAAL